MSAHNCPGLRDCLHHPRVFVWLGPRSGAWNVTTPTKDTFHHLAASFPHYAEAVAEANRHARDLALTAVQSQPGVTP